MMGFPRPENITQTAPTIHTEPHVSVLSASLRAAVEVSFRIGLELKHQERCDGCLLNTADSRTYVKLAGLLSNTGSWSVDSLRSPSQKLK